MNIDMYVRYIMRTKHDWGQYLAVNEGCELIWVDNPCYAMRVTPDIAALYLLQCRAQDKRYDYRAVRA